MEIQLVSWPKEKSINEVTDDIVLITGKSLEGMVGKEQFLLSKSKEKTGPIFSMLNVNDEDIQKLKKSGIIVERIS